MCGHWSGVWKPAQISKGANTMSNKPGGGDGGCACNRDPFASLPPEMRPQRKEATGGLRKATCPVCGLNYWTNRGADICIAFGAVKRNKRRALRRQFKFNQEKEKC
jgi:hypothetical protein